MSLIGKQISWRPYDGGPTLIGVILDKVRALAVVQPKTDYRDERKEMADVYLVYITDPGSNNRTNWYAQDTIVPLRCTEYFKLLSPPTV